LFTFSIVKEGIPSGLEGQAQTISNDKAQMPNQAQNPKQYQITKAEGTKRFCHLSNLISSIFPKIPLLRLVLSEVEG